MDVRCFSTCVGCIQKTQREKQISGCLLILSFFNCLNMSALVSRAKITLKAKAREYCHSLGSVKSLEVAEEFHQEYTLCNGFQETELHSIHQH